MIILRQLNGIQRQQIKALLVRKTVRRTNKALLMRNTALDLCIIGVRQNYVVAKEWFGKACDNGYQNGCDAYKELNQQGY